MHVAALFDMDGLLIDSERAIMAAWIAVAQSWGVEFSEAIYAETVGRDAVQSNTIVARAFGGLDAARAARAEVVIVLERKPPAERFPLKTGAKPLLDALKRKGIRCAVASSSTKHEIEARLTAAGILHYFAAAAGGDEVPSGKPDPAVYRLAAARLGVPAARCLAFEDSLNGAHAVLASGAGLVLVSDLVQPTADLAGRSIGVLRSLEEAIPHVGVWFDATRDA